MQFDATRPLGAEEQKKIQQTEAHGVKIVVVTEAATKEEIRQLVRQGNLAQFADKGFVAELRSWLRFSEDDAVEKGDGLASPVTGKPFAPAWIINAIFDHIVTGESQAATDDNNIRSSPAIVALVASQDNIESWINVGRVYQRIALVASSLGLQTAFVNQPIEVRNLRPKLNHALHLPETETIHLLFRLGYPMQNIKVPHSLRRPVESVME